MHESGCPERKKQQEAVMLAAMVQAEADDRDQSWASDVDCGLHLSPYLFATYSRSQTRPLGIVSIWAPKI